MKNVTLAMILLLIVSLSAAIAQDTQLNKAQKRQSLRVASTTATTVSSTTSTTCDGSGRGFGDGTKPRPQDGTGFGARSQNRQHRNARIDKGQFNGPRNGQGKRLGKNQADNERRKACNGTCASNTVTIENK